MFVSLIGTWIQSIAQSWLVFRLTNSSFLLGVVGFLSSMPIFFLSLIGGVAADRMNKKNILILTQVIFMILAFILAYLTQKNLITPVQIMIIAVLNGVVMSFDGPARQAIVVELVGKDHLLNAIALNSVSFNSSRIIGPAVCGILISFIGMSGCFYINGISFFAVIAALLLIRHIHRKPEKNNSAIDDLQDGLRFIKRNRLILVLISMVGVSSLFGISYVILMPVFAEHVLGVGVKGLGILMSSSGLGALIAGLILARLGNFKYKGGLLVVSSLAFSLFLMLFSLSRSYIFALPVLIFTGGFSVMAVALVNTILQTIVEHQYRGRVMSVFMFTFAGMMPFGNLIAGSLAQWIGVSLALLACGLACFVFFSLVNIVYPDIWKA